MVFSPKAASRQPLAFGNTPQKLFTNRDKSLIPVTKPGGEALKFQGGFEYIGIVYYFSSLVEGTLNLFLPGVSGWNKKTNHGY